MNTAVMRGSGEGHACAQAVVRVHSDLDSDELGRVNKGEMIVATHTKVRCQGLRASSFQK